MTKEALEKLTEKQRKAIEGFKKDYEAARDKRSNTAMANQLGHAKTYLKAIEDAGTITRLESRCIFTYVTL